MQSIRSWIPIDLALRRHRPDPAQSAIGFAAGVALGLLLGTIVGSGPVGSRLQAVPGHLSHPRELVERLVARTRRRLDDQDFVVLAESTYDGEDGKQAPTRARVRETATV